MPHDFMGLAYAEKRDFARAIQELETAAKLEDGPTTKGFLAHVRALAGQKQEAGKLVGELRDLYQRRYVCPYEVACAYISMGDKDRAFEWMRRGVHDRADCMLWLRNEPWLDPIRSDPRYRERLKQVGFADKAR